MGEAKRRRSTTNRFLERHPFCCYCGGATLASERDHVPSRQMFKNRSRPNGLEVPACRECNRFTSAHEQVAALMGRLYPDAETESEKQEIERIMRAVQADVPGLLEEMHPSVRQLKRKSEIPKLRKTGVGVLNCGGPLLNQSIQIFGAKLGFALHYSHTGRIVPKAGGVAVRWYSNVDALENALPNEIMRFMGGIKTLEQGSWNVGEQFSYAYVVSEEKTQAAYFSTFNFSFAVLSWVSEELSDRSSDTDISFHRPGAFR